jgi:hypothetical protein
VSYENDEIHRLKLFQTRIEKASFNN